MRGYGVYCWLADVCNATPARKIKYQPEDLAWDIHEDAEFVKHIAEDYELFVIEDGYLIDAFQRTKEAEEKARQEAIRQNRREAAKRAAATRKRNKEEREKTSQESEGEKSEPASDSETEPALKVVEEKSNPVVVPVACNYTYCSKEPMPGLPDTTPIKEFGEGEFDERFRKAREAWNKAFVNYKRRQVHALFPSSQTFHFFMQTCSVYSDEDIQLALEEAAKDKTFVWQFKDAIKPDNIQRLLSIREQREVAEEESLTPDQRELIDYIRRNHLNWDE